MHVFLYEYTCSVADPGLPPSWRVEGQTMLTAVAEDFTRVPGITAGTLLAAGRKLDVPGCQTDFHEGAEKEAFARLAAAADWTVVIAPDSEDVLRTRCSWALQAGSRLLGPELNAIERTTDKLALARHFTEQRIPTPATHAWPQAGFPYPAVLKPRFGAGSQATFLLAGADEGRAAADLARQELGLAELILQPFAPGLAVSVALLVGKAGVVSLLPAEQHLSTDGRFRYQGGRLPLPPPLAARARFLASRAVAAVPGLCGYVGVDLVLGAKQDGSQDVVIEINPRLTTSYVGLRRLAKGNLAEAMLRAALGGPLPELSWRPGVVRFLADGQVLEEW
jgi:predicted ATP-grasp superfamily ATP-dependent carboligase